MLQRRFIVHNVPMRTMRAKPNRFAPVSWRHATNMAGRVLTSSPGVTEVGGLHVIGRTP